jgi:hypothetical protein
MPRLVLTPLFFLAIAFAVSTTALAQTRPAAGLTDGAELFAAGCAGCHGPRGSGASDSAIGFEKPSTYPDFTACEAELLYQPIGFRWAQNLKPYSSAFEPRRFTEYYDGMVGGATATLASARR